MEDGDQTRLEATSKDVPIEVESSGEAEPELTQPDTTETQQTPAGEGEEAEKSVGD